MVRDGLIFYLLDFFELGNVIKAAFQCSVKICTREIRKILFVYFYDTLFAKHISGFFNETQVFVNEVIQRIDPRRYGYGASGHGKVHVGSTTLRGDHLFSTAIIPRMRPERMMPSAGHPVKVLLLRGAAHCTPCAALIAGYSHIGKR